MYILGTSTFSHPRSFVGKRKTVAELCSALALAPATRSTLRLSPFVGQSSRNDQPGAGAAGMDQQRQQHTLAQFRKGVFNVLIATSVAEEGLDVGEVDLIVCMEPVSSPVRLVQRFGRTGRQRDGHCVLLLTRQEKSLYESTQRRAATLAAAIDAGRGIELCKAATPMLPPRIEHNLACEFFDPMPPSASRDDLGTGSLRFSVEIALKIFFAIAFEIALEIALEAALEVGLLASEG